LRSREPIAEPVPAQVRHEVVGDVLPVGPLRRRAQPGRHLVVDPPGQEVLDGLPAVVPVLAGGHADDDLREGGLCGGLGAEPAALGLAALPTGAGRELGPVPPGAVATLGQPRAPLPELAAGLVTAPASLERRALHPARP
jgi:hypothetical protein